MDAALPPATARFMLLPSTAAFAVTSLPLLTFAPWSITASVVLLCKVICREPPMPFFAVAALFVSAAVPALPSAAFVSVVVLLPGAVLALLFVSVPVTALGSFPVPDAFAVSVPVFEPVSAASVPELSLPVSEPLSPVSVVLPNTPAMFRSLLSVSACTDTVPVPDAISFPSASVPEFV